MSSSRTIVVDDSDPRISYSQSWFADNSGDRNNLGNFGPTLDSTLHGVNQSGLIQFTFSGTQISVFGSNNPPPPGRRTGHRNATQQWECFIDNVPQATPHPFDFAVNNWPFCEIQGLSDGPHTLKLTVQTSGQTFWFDYLRYTPSANVSTENELLRIDNTDPSFRFGSGWSVLVPVGNVTQVEGSMVAYQFFGTRLSWYGLYPVELSRGPSRGSWSIDGSPSQIFEFPGLPAGANSTEFNQLLFQTPSLPLGHHSLNVFYDGLSTQQAETPLTLDFILVQNGTGTPSPSTSVTTASPPPPQPVSSTTASKNHGALIAAVVCGILVFFLLIALAVVQFRRTRKRKQADRVAAGVDIIEPYTLRPPATRSPHTHTRDYSAFRPAALRATVVRYARSVRSAWSGGSNGGGSSAGGGGAGRSRPIPSPTTSQIQREERRVISQSKLLQPVRNSLLPPIPSASGSPGESTQDRIESMPYHGGIQTWGELKAQEAAAHRGRQRDSYI